MSNAPYEQSKEIWNIENDVLATKFQISSLFGVERETHLHSGLDVTSVEGKVFACANGIVLYDAFSESFGNWIGIYDPIEDKLHRYGHMKTRSVYDVGNEVSVGDFIGYIGNTGRSTGPHIHWDIILCKGRDPRSFNFEKLSVENGDFENPAEFLGLSTNFLVAKGKRFTVKKSVSFNKEMGYIMEYKTKSLS